MRRATDLVWQLYHRTEISIHALREEGDLDQEPHHRILLAISIHALREEGDFTFGGGDVTLCISIHALREEGDTIVQQQGGWGKLFLSTPSVRRATKADLPGRSIRNHFYPRPP